MGDADYKLAHCLNSVLGWVELGNIREARAELQSIPPEYEDNLDVLELRWILSARECDWDGALKVAERVVQSNPQSASGWLHKAYALRRTANGGLQQASEILRLAFEKFPSEPTIAYNLSCYACQLGSVEEARHWLGEAVKRGEQATVKAMALADADLERLWPEIRKW